MIEANKKRPECEYSGRKLFHRWKPWNYIMISGLYRIS